MTTDDYKALVPTDAEKFALIAFDTREQYWFGHARMFDGTTYELQDLRRQYIHVATYGPDTIEVLAVQ